VRVVIADDEELARARLRRLLGAHGDVQIVGEFADGAAAQAALPQLAPDLLLLDIRMPLRDGFDVAAAVAGRPCAVVFVTAYSEHAVRAFDAGAADYLLKPVDGERLALSLARARARAGARWAVREEGRLVFLAAAEVSALVSRRNYVEVRAAGRRYRLRTPLSALEGRLEPGAFVRVHRSVLLRAARIAAIEPLLRGEYLVTMEDGATFTSTRVHRAALRRALGLPEGP
jgi:two-component system, LytTR family, response regulator